MTTGIIKQIIDDKLIVEITCLEACAQCAQKSHCALSQQSTKMVEVYCPYSHNYHINNKVELELDEISVWYSLIFSYAVPLIVMLVMLGVGYALEYSDNTCALLSLSVVPFYYFLLSKCQSKFKKIIKISIKQNSVD